MKTMLKSFAIAATFLLVVGNANANPQSDVPIPPPPPPPAKKASPGNTYDKVPPNQYGVLPKKRYDSAQFPLSTGASQSQSAMPGTNRQYAPPPPDFRPAHPVRPSVPGNGQYAPPPPVRPSVPGNGQYAPPPPSRQAQPTQNQPVQVQHTISAPFNVQKNPVNVPNEAKFGAGIKDDIKAKKQQYDRKLLTQAEARVAEHDKEKGLQNQKESTIRANLRTMLEPPPANETKATKQTRLDRNKALSKENDKLTKEIEASKKRQQLLQKQSKKDSKPLDAAHKKATKPLKKEDKKVEKKIGKVEKNATKRARGKKG